MSTFFRRLQSLSSLLTSWNLTKLWVLTRFEFDHIPCTLKCTEEEPLTNYVSHSCITSVPDATGCCRLQALPPKIR